MAIITKEDERFGIVRKLHESVSSFWKDKGPVFTAWWDLASQETREKVVKDAMPEIPSEAGPESHIPELSLKELATVSTYEESLVAYMEHFAGARFDYKLEEEIEATDDSLSFFEDQFEIAAEIFEEGLFKSQYAGKGHFFNKVDNNFVHINKMNHKIQACIDEGLFLDARVVELVIVRSTQLLGLMDSIIKAFASVDVSTIPESAIKKKVTTNEPSCAICEKKSCANGDPLLKCGRCKSSAYCSKECQVKHWPLHKISCAAAANTTPKK